MGKSGQAVHDGKGDRIDSLRVKQILGDITKKVDSYRAEWLDADFKLINRDLYMHYDHRIIGGNLKPQKTEKLELCLMEDCSIDINSANRQGLPIRKASSGISYWYPRSDNNSVAWFGADSVGVFLDCDGDPRGSDGGLGVRVAKIR